MLIRLMAPTIVDYFEVPGALIRDPRSSAEFWGEQQDAVTDLVSSIVEGDDGGLTSITLEHAVHQQTFGRYRTISKDSLDRPLQVMSGTIQPDQLQPELDPSAAHLLAGVTQVEFRLFDHGVVLVEVLADADAWWHAASGSTPQRSDELQRAAVVLAEALAYDCVHRFIDPVLALLRAGDHKHRIILPASRATAGTTPTGHTLWVSRAIIVGSDDPIGTSMIPHWLKDASSGTHDDSAASERLLAGELDNVTRWLNYVYMDRDGTGGEMTGTSPIADSWQALRYAQYFYAAMDLIDHRLSRILADTIDVRPRSGVADLQEQLQSLSHRAEVIVMGLQDVSKYLKRSVRAEMDAILQAWEFHRLLEQPVRFKIGTCDRRLSEIAAKRSSRSTLYTDLILLGIAVTSILGTALALSDFGRSIAVNPDMAGYGVVNSSLTEWFASQPADTMVVSSAIVSLLVVLSYLHFRRKGSA